MTDSYEDLGSFTLKFPSNLNWEENPSSEIDISRYLYSPDGSSFLLEQITGSAPIRLKKKLTLYSRSELYTLVDFFNRNTFGELRPFWIFHPKTAFTLKQDSLSGSSELYCNYNGFELQAQGYERIYIKMIDGSILTRKITSGSYSETNNLIILNLETPLDRDITLDNHLIIGRYLLVRFEGESLEISYINDLVSETTLQFLEVVKEYDLVLNYSLWTSINRQYYGVSGDIDLGYNMRIAMNEDGSKFIAVGIGRPHSYNDGVWTIHSTPTSGNYTSCDISGDGTQFICSVGTKIWKYNGSTWSEIQPASQTWLCVRCTPDFTKFVAVYYGGAYIYNGSSWTLFTSPTVYNYACDISDDGNTVVVTSKRTPRYQSDYNFHVWKNGVGWNSVKLANRFSLLQVDENDTCGLYSYESKECCISADGNTILFIVECVDRDRICKYVIDTESILMIDKPSVYGESYQYNDNEITYLIANYTLNRFGILARDFRNSIVNHVFYWYDGTKWEKQYPLGDVFFSKQKVFNNPVGISCNRNATKFALVDNVPFYYLK